MINNRKINHNIKMPHNQNKSQNMPVPNLSETLTTTALASAAIRISLGPPFVKVALQDNYNYLLSFYIKLHTS